MGGSNEIHQSSSEKLLDSDIFSLAVFNHQIKVSTFSFIDFTTLMKHISKAFKTSNGSKANEKDSTSFYFWLQKVKSKWLTQNPTFEEIILDFSQTMISSGNLRESLNASADRYICHEIYIYLEAAPKYRDGKNKQSMYLCCGNKSFSVSCRKTLRTIIQHELKWTA